MLEECLKDVPSDKPVEIWFQDEARVGQKNGQVYQWAPKGTRPRQAGTPDFVNDWVGWGAGTRAAQFLSLGAKARALLNGRSHVTKEDIIALAAPVLRHRVLVNYRAEAEGVSVGKVIERVLAEVK